jgi:hypothetical protein
MCKHIYVCLRIQENERAARDPLFAAQLAADITKYAQPVTLARKRRSAAASTGAAAAASATGGANGISDASIKHASSPDSGSSESSEDDEVMQSASRQVVKLQDLVAYI